MATKKTATKTPPAKEAPPAKKKSIAAGLGLKVDRGQVQVALELLQEYVREREVLIKQAGKLDLQQAVALMDALNTFKENVAAMAKSPAEKAYDTLRFAVIPALMEDQDIRTITYEGIGRINAMDDIQVSTLDKPGLKKWLESVDLEDLIQETVNAQTLAAALRARLKDGKDMPPEDVVKVTPITRAQITRSA